MGSAAAFPERSLDSPPGPDKSDGQALAALGATTRQDLTTVLGGHTGTETVGTSALEGAGLESAFHDALPGGHYGPEVAPVQRDRQFY